MPPEPGPVIAAFARRIAIAGAIEGAALATFAIAALVATGALIARVAGVVVAPDWTAALLLAPIAAVAVWRARAVRLPRAIAAAHLDRRLGLDGLLLAADAGGLDASWRGELAARLAGWRAALPRPRWRRFAPWPVAALALAALLLAWPARSPTAARGPGALAATVAGLQSRIAESLALGLVSPELLAELAGKAAELAARALPDDPSTWRELDALGERLAREQRLAGLEPQRGSGEPAGAAERAAALASAVEALRVFAADERLSAMARTLLERALAEAGAAGPDAPERAREHLQQLAGELAAAGNEAAAAALALAGAVDSEQLAQAAELLRDAAGAAAAAGATGAAGGSREPASPRAGNDPSGAHAAAGAAAAIGGGDRPARVHAPTPGGAARELALPEHAAVPREWVPIGTRVGEPGTAPRAGTPTGAVAPADAGGATWDQRIAPRHRAVVQRFFAADGANGRERR